MKKAIFFSIFCLMIAGCSESNNSQDSPASQSDPCQPQCTANQTCQNGVCIPNTELCGGNQCGANQICQNNQCVDKQDAGEQQLLCAGKKCGENQICQNEQCVDKQDGGEQQQLCGGKKCGENQICQNEQCVDKQDGGEQQLCGGKKCAENQICQNDQCVDKQDGGEQQLCGGKKCAENQICQNNQCVDKQDGGEQQLCGGKKCAENQICQNNQCVDQTKPECTENKSRCSNDLIQYCTNGNWGTPQSCGENKICKDDICQDKSPVSPEDPRKCGSTTCKDSQLCVNNQCAERNNKAEEGKPCDPKTFLESCDGNQLVICKVDPEGKEAPATQVIDCDNLKCALRADMNYGFCVKADPECKTQSKFTLCYDQSGIKSYVEHMDCALATDGKYYPFRTDHETSDCIDTCIDDYTCDVKEDLKSCQYGKTEDKCIGTVLEYCNKDNKIYHIACGRAYKTTCLSDAKDCDWENASYDP